MFRQFCFAVVIAFITGATGGSTYFLFARQDGLEQRNDLIHALAAQDRARLDAENKSSIADRQHIADQLSRLASENRDSIRDRLQISSQLRRIEEGLMGRDLAGPEVPR